MGFVEKLVKNPIFNMVRKVAEDNVEDFCANHEKWNKSEAFRPGT